MRDLVCRALRDQRAQQWKISHAMYYLHDIDTCAVICLIVLAIIYYRVLPVCLMLPRSFFCMVLLHLRGSWLDMGLVPTCQQLARCLEVGVAGTFQ